jgi:hypothetical protein
VRATDSSGKLRFRSEPAEVDIAPGSTSHVNIHGTAKPLLVSGRPVRRQMAVTVEVDGETLATAPVAATQEPLVPRWVLRAVAVVMALAALLVVVKLATSHRPTVPTLPHVPGKVHSLAPIPRNVAVPLIR